MLLPFTDQQVPNSSNIKSDVTFDQNSNSTKSSNLSSRFNELKILANDSLYNRTRKRLTSEQEKILECLSIIISRTNILLSYFEDKIKASFCINEEKYIIDFSTDLNDKSVLIGKLDQDKKYSLEESDIDSLESYLKSLESIF